MSGEWKRDVAGDQLVVQCIRPWVWWPGIKMLRKYNVWIDVLFGTLTFTAIMHLQRRVFLYLKKHLCWAIASKQACTFGMTWERIFGWTFPSVILCSDNKGLKISRVNIKLRVIHRSPFPPTDTPSSTLHFHDVTIYEVWYRMTRQVQELNSLDGTKPLSRDARERERAREREMNCTTGLKERGKK